MAMLPENETGRQLSSFYDVIISGAGPVGLLLACELALANCSVMVLEKAAEPSSVLKKLPFGIRGLSAPSIEALDRRGLLKELEIHKHLANPHQHAGTGTRRQVGHFAGIPFHEGNIDSSRWLQRLESFTPTSMISEMEELETVLARRATALGVKIKRGLVVTGFNQQQERVSVIAGDRVIESKWLVGCDGSRSIVRKAGRFEFAGTEPEFTGYSVKADIADPEKLKNGRTVTPKGMYLQSQPGYFVMQDFDGGDFHQSGKPLDQPHVQEVLRRISETDVTVRRLEIASTWTDRARQATSYRNGQVLLAGDAAHIHAPLGGQGLNLGLGDAMNLGWKLAATIKNKAPQGLLNSYQLERHPIGAQVLDWSRAQAALMKADPASRALNAIVRDLMDTRDGATYFAGRVWGVNIQYDLGDGHPWAGRSVPNFEFENGERVGGLLHDGNGLLLDFDATPALERLADSYRGQLKYIAGNVKKRLGLSVVLVRPDGIIAWAAEKDITVDTLQEALDRWFVTDEVPGD